MINLTKSKALVATALVATAFAVTPAAYAGNYNQNNCKSSSDDQIIAGIVGAVAGGVLGSQVSGRGARTEGSVIGAAIGAAAGAGLAGGNDCNKTQTRRANSYTTSSPTYGGRNNSSRTTTTTTYSHDNGSYNTAYNRHAGPEYSSNYVHTSTPRYSRKEQLAYLDYRIDELRDRRQRLETRARYKRSHKLERKIYNINLELRDLKDQRRSLKKSKTKRVVYTTRRY